MVAHKVLPDLPEYVDPLKDGQAATQNWHGSLTTLEDECSARGKDWKKIVDQRAIEKEYLDSKDLTIGELASAAAADATVEDPGQAPAKPETPPAKPKPKKKKLE
jgi:capsid protein